MRSKDVALYAVTLFLWTALGVRDEMDGLLMKREGPFTEEECIEKARDFMEGVKGTEWERTATAWCVEYPEGFNTSYPIEEYKNVSH